MKQSHTFFEKVHAIVSRIPVGKVMTYGQIAQLVGSGYSARYVGYAMAKAPSGLPSHRVVNRLGEMANSTIFGGASQQQKLLESEGVIFNSDGRIDLSISLYYPR